MSNGNWIKLHRKMLEWEWYDDINTCRLFIHLLLRVNWEPKKWHGIDVLPGQIITSREKLSAETGLTQQAIRTALNRLKSTNGITNESTNNFSLITVINWESYQSYGQQSTNETTSELTSEQPATNQQLTTTKEYKNIKNIRNKNNISLSKQVLTADEKKANLKKEIEKIVESLKAVWYENLNFYMEKYPNLDYNLIFETIINWVESNPTKAKKRSNWNLFLQNWLNREKPKFYPRNTSYSKISKEEQERSLKDLEYWENFGKERQGNQLPPIIDSEGEKND
jgi:biotin operon repressor